MQDTHDTAAVAEAPQADPKANAARTGSMQYPIPGSQVGATALASEKADGWHVSLEFGCPSTGGFLRYLSANQARALAASLVAAADHYDAETARLAGA